MVHVLRANGKKGQNERKKLAAGAQFNSFFGNSEAPSLSLNSTHLGDQDLDGLDVILRRRRADRDERLEDLDEFFFDKKRKEKIG